VVGVRSARQFLLAFGETLDKRLEVLVQAERTSPVGVIVRPIRGPRRR